MDRTGRQIKAIPGIALAVAAMWAPAHAQQAASRGERIEVTGSRLPTSSDMDSPSPVTLIDAKDIQVEGYQSLELILNNYPQFVPGQGNRISQDGTGTATANLRGMGPGRTLVLVNGKRLPAGSPFVLSPDLNQVPPQLIKRVEVLTGGASAVYGADAIAGVVNFIMNDRFEGVGGSVSYDFYNHRQKNGLVQEMLRELGQPIPRDKWLDGRTGAADLTVGANFPGNRGNAVASFRYLKSKALLQSERDYSACPLGFPSDGFIPVPDDGSVPHCTAFGARYFIWDFEAPFPTTRDPETGLIRDYRYTDTPNTSLMTYFQRPQERYLLNASANYEVSPRGRVYGEFGYHDDRSDAQIAPVMILHDVAVSYENPFLTEDWRSALVFRGPDGRRGTGPGTAAFVSILSRNHEAPPRQDRLRNKSHRELIGLKGQGGGWDYDVYLQNARVQYRNEFVNDFSFTRVARALDVVTDPATGAPACRSAIDGTDRSCAPYNAWNGTVSPAALAYVLSSASQRSTISQRILGGSLRANLGDYGIKVPNTREAPEIALGLERRKESLAFDPGGSADLESYHGNPFPPPKPVNGGFTVRDLFAEVRLPMTNLATLSGTYRRSDSDRGPANTFGAGFNTAPLKSTWLRGSYQRAIRSPNLLELFRPQTSGFYFLAGKDPCEGEAPTRSLVDCQRTGVTAAQYGRIREYSGEGYPAVVGGNPALEVEKANTYTVGVVFVSPGGLSLTVDYFDIRIEDTISAISGGVIFTQCIETGDPVFCANIRRDPATGALWFGAGHIVAINQNIGKTRSAGADLSMNYRFMLPQSHRLSVDFLGSWLDASTVEEYKGALERRCEGTFHSKCSTVPLPRWRHRLRLTWQPLGGVDLAATWRHIGSTRLSGAASSNRVTTRLAPVNYLDLAGSWSLSKAVTLRAGIANLMDRDPPLVVSTGGVVNGNTFAQLYDALGRHVFMSITARF